MADNHSYQWLPDPKTIVYKPTISHIHTSNKHNTTKKERFCEDQKYSLNAKSTIIFSQKHGVSKFPRYFFGGVSLNISLYKERDGWVDKYLVKRNSYQLLSAPVSIWLARAPGGKNKTFHISAPISSLSLHLLFPRLTWIFWRSRLLRGSVSCETLSFMHEPSLTPHNFISLSLH